MFPKRRAFAAPAVGDQLKFSQDFGIRQLLLAAMCSFCVLSLAVLIEFRPMKGRRIYEQRNKEIMHMNIHKAITLR